MTTVTLTITEFLLARIAEVEADSRAVGDRGCAECGFDAVRECEAKRRIVERETEQARVLWRRGQDEHRLTFEQWQEQLQNLTMRDLAAIYADHPDYREEWKP